MIKSVDGIITHLYKELKSFTDIAVVGMSGGADSTLTAILCAQALGQENVISLHMPVNDTDEKTFNKDSLASAKALGIEAHLVNLQEPFEVMMKHLQGGVQSDFSRVNAGNLRARLRMSTLYSYAHHYAEKRKKRVRVIGTGNLSEDYIGYDTKGGDALADIFPLGELFKSEVYQLLDYYRDVGVIDDSLINRVPSAGLWQGQTDEGELGHTYKDMEASIRKALKGELSCETSDDIDAFVYQRHLNHKHKHEAAFVVGTRQYCD